MTKENITVLGRKISYEIKDVDIYILEYYPDNPRINYIISRTHPEKITQEFIGDELFKLCSTKDRIKDLEENKGLLDEIYVLGNKVVEGNTRLCAYRYLQKKHPEDPRWKFIKSRILQDDVTDEELFYILGTFHIKGKTEWDAYEKAAYIYKMIKVLKKNPEDVAKQLGKQRKTVEAMLKAYEAMSKKYLMNSDNTEIVNGARDELKKYSYFEAFFLQKDLVTRVNETPAFLDEFVQWVKEDRFKRAQEVRELPKILGNKKAFKSFYESGADEAFDESMHVLYENKPEKVDKFYKKIREFREFIKESEVLKVKNEIDSNKNKKTELQQCYKDLKRFCKEVGLDIQ